MEKIMSDIYYVDEIRIEMKPRNEWPTLGLEELLSTRTIMVNKYDSMRNEASKKMIVGALLELEHLIQKATIR